MTIFSSVEALDNSTLQLGEDFPKTNSRLTSHLFAGNEVLQAINAGKESAIVYSPETYIDNEGNTRPIRRILEGEHIVDIKKALKIIVPEVSSPNDEVFELARTLVPNEIYDYEAEKLIKFVQEIFVEFGGDADGIVGPEVLFRLDKELNKIQLYTTNEKAHTIFNVSKASPAGFFTVVTSSNAVVYKEPIPPSDLTEAERTKNTIKSLDIDETVHVVSYDKTTGWLYVQVTENQITSNIPLDVNEEDEEAEAEELRSKVLGFIDKFSVWTKKDENDNLVSGMPDPNAMLKKLQPGDSLYDIILNTYYKWQADSTTVAGVTPYVSGGGAHRTNAYGIELNTEKPYQGTMSYFQKLKEYNLFKFYINLLLYSNNPKGWNFDSQQSIYLTGGESSAFSEDMLDNLHAFDNQSPNESNYDYLLRRLKVDFSAGWEWSNGQSQEIAIAGGTSSGTSYTSNHYLWIPSNIFATSIYAYVSNDHTYLAYLNDLIRDEINKHWPRGFGYGVEGAIGATFGIPIALDLGGFTYIYRAVTENPDEVVLRIRKYGTLSLGLDTGVGAAFFAGVGGKKSNSEKAKKYGLSAQIGLQIQRGVKIKHYAEYEFPLHNTSNWQDAERRDLGALCAFSTLLSIGDIEFDVVSFISSFSNYNLDPNQYLVHSKIWFGGYADNTLAGDVGLRFGNADEPDNFVGNMWRDNEDGPPFKKAPFLISQLTRALRAQLGVSSGGEIGFGYEYEAEFDDECFDKVTGCRVPAWFQQTTYADKWHYNNKFAIAGSILNQVVASDRGVGLKFQVEYRRPDIDSMNKLPSDFDPDFNNLLYQNRPKISPFIFSGNLDEYDGPGNEYSVSFDRNALSFPSSIDELFSFIEEFHFHKRINLYNFATGQLEWTVERQEKIKTLLGNKDYFKFGITTSAYIDIKGTINIAQLLNNGGFDSNSSGDPCGTTMAEETNVAVLMKCLFNALYDDINSLNLGSSPIEQLIFDVIKYFDNVNPHRFLDPVFFILKRIYEAIEIDDLSIHGETSFGAAGGGKVRALASVRLDASAYIVKTFDHQIVKKGVHVVPQDIDNPNRADESILKHGGDFYNLINDSELLSAFFTFYGDQNSTQKPYVSTDD